LRATPDLSMRTGCRQSRYPAVSRKTACRSVCRSSVRPGERSRFSASLTRLNKQPTGRPDARSCDALDLPETLFTLPFCCNKPRQRRAKSGTRQDGRSAPRTRRHQADAAVLEHHRRSTQEGDDGSVGAPTPAKGGQPVASRNRLSVICQSRPKTCISSARFQGSAPPSTAVVRCCPAVT